MSLGPFLKREMTTSVRGSRVFSDRRVAAILMGAMVLGAMLVWDYQGWDRSTILGSHRFGLVTLGMMVAAMVLLTMGVVVIQVASAIASERDRKTLDALLASRFSSTEIVLGAVVGGLFRMGNSAMATLPVVVLMIYLVGVNPIWVVFSGVGLASMATLLAGFAVVASVESRTAARASTFATAMFGAWLALPPMFHLLRILSWPGLPWWLNSIVMTLLEGNPMGILLHLMGLLPGPGGPIGVVGRLVAWQVLGALGMVAWSILRLRPASRSLYDVEGEKGRVNRLKAALRRSPRRPSCGDDPVFWHEVHATRGVGRARRWLGRAIGWGWIASLALGVSYLAWPAFEELMSRGYVASPEAFAMPELHPLMRLMIKRSLPKFAPHALPGQARLELNMVLRMFAGLYSLAIPVVLFSNAFEGMKAERRRDTWLGLIVTPLTGREILRGKLLGMVWRTREVGFTLVGLWVVGLAAGSVHWLGFLLSVALLAALGAFYGSLGNLAALIDCEQEIRGRTALSPAYLPALMMGSIMLIAGPVVLGWASLLTYEDVAAATRSGPFPEWREGVLADWVGARSVVVLCLAGTVALACGALRLSRYNDRWFDEAVGRPVRPASDAARPGARLGEGPAPAVGPPAPLPIGINTRGRP